VVQGRGAPNAYLSAFSDRQDVFRLVIDAYRLRVETDHLSRGEDHGIYYPGKSIEGLVWAQGDGQSSLLLHDGRKKTLRWLGLTLCLTTALEDFQRFLDLAEASQILPKWWQFEERMECLTLAIDKTDAESIYKPISQAELPTRYEGDMSVRVALAILAELAVGYDGKGPAKDDTWFIEFQEFLDLHPEERARLIKGSIEMADQVLKEFQSNPN
jgi:hypothetical protein